MQDLWMMRMLVDLDALAMIGSRHSWDPESLVGALRLSDVDVEDRESVLRAVPRLKATLKAMERRRAQYRLPSIREGNIKLIARRIAFSSTEQKVLALVILLRAHDAFHRIGAKTGPSVNVVEQVVRVIGSPYAAAAHALGPASLLIRSRLIDVRAGGNLCINVSLKRASFRRLAFQRLQNLQDVFRGLIRSAPVATLGLDDFAYMAPAPEHVVELLREALANRRVGVNILFYGPPGTGKTEVARTLAAAASASLFEVCSDDIDGQSLSPADRLGAASAAQLLLFNSRSLLAFDETDAIFNDGSELFGKPSTAEIAKCWVNELLERNKLPTIWIANRIWKMDPAFLRRFDLVIRLASPPMEVRHRLIRHQCGEFLSADEVRRFAQIEQATPALIVRAASVAGRIAGPNDRKAQLLEVVLDGVLKAQGYTSVRRACQGALPEGYDLTYCNPDADLSALGAGLKRHPVGRICLYGPPGTGKTAFGLWLANATGRALIQKRASDIQSAWLGGMEKKLAQAFERASREGAILQIDEVDSFLQDRTKAQRSWEVTQVNEFLTQLEGFDGIFVASTNLMEGLDPAALRRFDYKVQMNYLRPWQCRAMFIHQLAAFGMDAPDENLLDQIETFDRLTPGDFAVITRQHRIAPFPTTVAVFNALRLEQRAKGFGQRRIGFV
jgi:SpoVK/Ycf46/Vps4 family AAA+-type ATPase